MKKIIWAVLLGFALHAQAAIYGPLGVANFGQTDVHGTYQSFNTTPKNWGWSFVQGTVGAPNALATQWYRGRFALGSNYQSGIQGGAGPEYWMEIAIPRYPVTARAAAGTWTRVNEYGTASAWVAMGDPVPAWTAPTLTNGWVNFGGGYNYAGYRKIGKRVELRGMVKSGTMGSPIFLLPTDHRPLLRYLFNVQSNGAIGRVDIDGGGNVLAYSGNNGWICLDGISFAID